MMIINLIGIAIIALIIWWFWFYTPKDTVNTNDQTITIVVDNGVYKPSRIKTKQGNEVTLQFLRKDPSPCAETVLFPSFEINQELPLDINTSVTIPAMQAGEYVFHCPMKMYTGLLVVE